MLPLLLLLLLFVLIVNAYFIIWDPLEWFYTRTYAICLAQIIRTTLKIERAYSYARIHTQTHLLLYCNKGKKGNEITKERNTELRWRWSWRRRRKWKWIRTILEGNKKEEKCVYTLKLSIWFMTLANWTVYWNITFVRAFWHCADWKRSFYWILLVNLFPIVLNERREKRERNKNEHTTNTLNAICMQMGN